MPPQANQLATDSITCRLTVCLPSFLPSPEQVATDALQSMERAMTRDGILTNDRQLACARINSQVSRLVSWQRVVHRVWWQAAAGLQARTCHHSPLAGSQTSINLPYTYLRPIASL